MFPCYIVYNVNKLYWPRTYLTAPFFTRHDNKASFLRHDNDHSCPVVPPVLLPCLTWYHDIIHLFLAPTPDVYHAYDLDVCPHSHITHVCLPTIFIPHSYNETTFTATEEWCPSFSWCVVVTYHNQVAHASHCFKLGKYYRPFVSFPPPPVYVAWCSWRNEPYLSNGADLAGPAWWPATCFLAW